MKKYTVENAKEFRRDALIMPPIELFENGDVDESQWFEDHKIRIIVGDHEIEFEYTADNVTELDVAIKEMYEAEMDIRNAIKEAK